MSKILVAIPIKPTLNPILVSKCLELVGKLPAANPRHQITVMFDFTPIAKADTDFTPWSKVCKARNLLLSKINTKDYDYLLWIDSDVVDYPLDMPTRLIDGNPEGISAPMVLIENGNIFYDYSAFIIQGKDHIEPKNRNRIDGRNLNPAYPYWPESPNNNIVDLDAVGTITLIPSWVYDYARYEDHPAFTDHYPLCKACRDQGKRVTVDRAIIAYHANLPDYGEQWH